MSTFPNDDGGWAKVLFFVLLFIIFCIFAIMKIGEAIERFLNYIKVERKYSDYTVRNYSEALQGFSDYLSAEGITDVETISDKEVRQWQMLLTDEGKQPRTVRLALAALSSWFRFLRREHIIHADIMVRIKSPKIPHQLPVTFRESEVEPIYDETLPIFADTFEGHRDRLLLRLLYETGMRRAEVVSLTEAAVDLSTFSIKVVGKGNKERVIPIAPEMARAIGTYLDYKHRLPLQSERLLVRPDGKALAYYQVGTIVKRYMSLLSSAGRVTPHVFRHSFATHLLNEGADITAIKELLGHASLSTTEIYTHVTRRHLLETYKHAHPRALKKTYHEHNH